MPDVVRVSPSYVWDKLKSSADTELVCAYEDEEKHHACDLEGSIGLADFQAHAAMTPKEREIVFYCS